MLITLYEQAKKLMGIDRYLVYSSSRLEKQFEEIVRIAIANAPLLAIAKSGCSRANI
jgi:hypothetical protein